MEQKNDDLWIDLQSLVSGSAYEKGFETFFYQYCEDDKEPKDDTLTFCLRKALRAVGHKITKIETYYNNDESVRMKSYKTTITEAEGEHATRLWNKYCDIFEEHN